MKNCCFYWDKSNCEHYTTSPCFIPMQQSLSEKPCFYLNSNTEEAKSVNSKCHHLDRHAKGYKFKNKHLRNSSWMCYHYISDMPVGRLCYGGVMPCLSPQTSLLNKSWKVCLLSKPQPDSPVWHLLTRWEDGKRAYLAKRGKRLNNILHTCLTDFWTLNPVFLQISFR